MLENFIRALLHEGVSKDTILKSLDDLERFGMSRRDIAVHKRHLDDPAAKASEEKSPHIIDSERAVKELHEKEKMIEDPSYLPPKPKDKEPADNDPRTYAEKTPVERLDEQNKFGGDPEAVKDYEEAKEASKDEDKKPKKGHRL